MAHFKAQARIWAPFQNELLSSACSRWDEEPEQRLHLCRVRRHGGMQRRGGGRRCQSQNVQVVYARQILQCRVPKEALVQT